MVPIKMQLDDSFFNEEIRNGYLVSGEAKRTWAIMLDMLNEFINVCNKYDIKWYGDAGTILGAARHKGMIPWDDDIDIMMMRDEYERFCKIAPDEFKHPFFFQSAYTEPGSSFCGHAHIRRCDTTAILKRDLEMKYPQNQGIFIDIFPIDAYPDDDNEASKLVSEVQDLKGRVYQIGAQYFWNKMPSNKKGKIKYIAQYLPRILKNRSRLYTEAYREFEDRAMSYNDKPTKRVAKLIMSPFKPRRIWNRSDFDHTVYLPFEMFQLPVPSGYENILDCFYGDWHICKNEPSTHGEMIFDVDRPYTEYLR